MVKNYYGQTSKTLEERWRGHLRAVKRGTQSYHLHRAIRKYGEQNFIMELMEEVAIKVAANEREMYYIDKDNTLEEGYNLTKGGEGSFGRIVSEDEKARKLATFKKTFEANGGFSEEHRQKLSEARKKHSGPNKGKEFSDEHRENLSLVHMGNTSRLGTGKLKIHIQEIKDMYKSGFSQKKIANIFDVSPSYISMIVNNKRGEKMTFDINT